MVQYYKEIKGNCITKRSKETVKQRDQRKLYNKEIKGNCKTKRSKESVKQRDQRKL
jgi:hypothetical protein